MSKNQKAYTAEQVIAYLRHQVERKGQNNYAMEIGVSNASMSMTLSRKRGVMPKVVEASGFEIRYVRKDLTGHS